MLITSLAASASFRGISPVDARTNEYVASGDVAFEASPIATIMEPFSAPAAIIVGAPDYRVAILSCACWLFAGSALFYWIPRRKLNIYVRTAKSCAVALALTLGFASYLCAFALFPLPGLILVANNPAIVVADLHSHTVASHDGLATQEENLRYHRARGYDVVAITDHASEYLVSCHLTPVGAPPETICGLEISISGLPTGQSYLVLLRIRPDLVLPYDQLNDREGRIREDGLRHFVSAVHDAGGAVIALSYLLDPDAAPYSRGPGLTGSRLLILVIPESLKSKNARC